MFKLNPLEHPICLEMPHRLSTITSWHGHIPFAMFLVDVVKPGIIVELGTHYGDSYCAFCQAVKGLKLATRCYAVDTWQGDPQAGSYGPEVLADLRAYHDPLYGSFSRLIQSTFDEAVSHFTDGTIDILHIDGYHIYDAIRHDFETWLPKVSKQGIIFLHDVNVLEKDYGARKFWDEINIKYPHFEFLHSHGLGVLAAGKTYPKELRNLFDGQDDEMAEVRDFFSQLGNRITDKIVIETKERENQSQKKEIETKDSCIVGINNTLQIVETRINTLKKISEIKDNQINELSNTLECKEAELKSFSAELKTKEIELTDKEAELKSLNTKLETKEKDLVDKEEELESLNAKLETKEHDLKDKEAALKNITNALENKENEIDDLIKKISYLEVQLLQIQRGILMQFRNRYQKVVEKIFPQGTRRRRYYQLYLKGIRIILNEGWKSFFRKVKRYKNSNHPIQIKIETTKLKELPKAEEEKFVSIEKKVSIIIPTKNAGKDFDLVLERIRYQKGLQEIKLIVIDSGSSDGTIQISQKYGAEIHTIKSEDFNHGLTRNLGATYATGDYILFMVQDAIPIGDYWLFQLVKALYSDNEIAGVTCRQIPQSNADLFCSFLMYNHDKFMGYDNDKVMQIRKENFDKLPAEEKRRHAGIENVCLCIKKDIFTRFKFKKMDFAEDLDLGIRLIESGHKIGFMHSAGVIHSHNRSAEYFMKRGYVENKILAGILKTNPTIIEADVDVILSGILYSYNCVNHSISLLSARYPKDIPIETFFRELKGCSNDYSGKSDNKITGDAGLELLLEEFQKILNRKPTKNNLLLESFLARQDKFQDYLQNINNRFETTQLCQAVYKTYSIWCGGLLGDLYFTRPGDEKLQKLDILLKKGI
jgi:glycosyltransferase involved in cell wall biosynthesis